MKKLNFEQMEVVRGGVSRAARNAGCAALGLAAGIASGCNPLVGGLTTLGCMLITDYEKEDNEC
ncbi:MAG: hypothetical protein LBG96_07975 [Tannerella sp.]|jgi:hypothetical protein|nr:hypothetical protein [Tannerella sp.]